MHSGNLRPKDWDSLVMKNGLVAIIALAAMIARPALAADLSVEPMYKALPPPPVLQNWSGFTVGIAFGARWSDAQWNTTCQETSFAPTCNVFPDRFANNNPTNFNSSSFRTGLYGGYTWQVARTWVVGWEGDVAWANNNKTLAGIPGLESPTVAGAPGGDTSSVKQTWEASIRGRGGVLVAPWVLLYATAGVAWTRLDASAHCGTAFPVGWCALAGNIGRTDTASTNRFGWTVGGGAEAMVWANWLVRAEYRYTDYGTFNYTLLQAPASNLDAFSAGLRYHTHTALVGFAYKFGTPASY
jgi:outer membrane immunogenic protein